jgi:hypothetical protein
VVGIMKMNEGCVCTLRRQIAEEHGGNGSHALTVPTLTTAQREAMQDVE